MPWSEANRAKYDVIRERYSSDLSDAEFGLIFPLASNAQETRTQADLRARDIERVLFDPLGLSLAAVAQGLPSVHDGAEPFLRLARPRIMDPNRLRPRDGRT